MNKNIFFKPKLKYWLTGPFLGTETEYAKNLKQNYEEFWNRNRAMKNLEIKTEMKPNYEGFWNLNRAIICYEKFRNRNRLGSEK